MALDRRYSHMQIPVRDCTTSVTIDLPNSSANQHQATTNNAIALGTHVLRPIANCNQQMEPDGSHIQIPLQDATVQVGDSHDSTDSTRILAVDLNNNIGQDNAHNNIHSETINILDFCHDQAATRSLLPENIPETSTSNAESEQTSTPPPNYHEIPGIVPAYQGRTSGPPPSYDEVVNPNAPPPSYQSLFGQAREARKTSNGLVDLFRQLLLILIGTLGCTMIIGFLLLIPITMILVGLVYVNQCRAENIPSFLVIGGLVWIVKNILNCYNQFKKDSTTTNRPPPRRVSISSGNNISGRAPTNAPMNHNTNHLTSSNTTTANNDTTGVMVDYPQIGHTRMIQTSVNNQQDSRNRDPSVSDQQHEPVSGATRVRASLVARESQVSSSRIRNPSLIGITSFKCESMLNYFLIVWFLAGCIVVYRIYEPDYDNPSSASYCNRTVYLYAFWLMTSACVTMVVVLSCLCCLMVSSLMSCNLGR